MKVIRLNTDETIKYLLSMLKSRFIDVDRESNNENLYAQGEYVGFRDCLKMAMAWEGAKEYLGEVDDEGLDLEKRSKSLKVLTKDEIDERLNRRRNGK